MENSSDIQVLMLACLLLPLLSFVLLFLAGRAWAKWAGWLATGISLLTFVLAAYFSYLTWFGPDALQPEPTYIEWFRLYGNTFFFGLYTDTTSGIMFFIVGFIALLVHLFSLDYMAQDPRRTTYFAYLGLFIFSMMGLLMTNHLVVIYCCWELVGLSSYLLIGFWQERTAALKAAKKAFLLNRIGDVGLLIAIMAIYRLTDSLHLPTVLANLRLINLAEGLPLLYLAGFGILLGAAGKSAQFPLSTWLPDAMEGPTPVSALIHAATMVAAGVYLLIRTQFLFLPEVGLWIALTGAFTAFLAAFAALSQTDIKKVLAYSTISQLGFMVMGVGVGAAEAALFHLLTHAFFKAGLFLAAGAVIHRLHQASEHSGHHFDTQDMRLMGGLRKPMPFTATAFGLCGLALAGLPLFSGFLSKDAILLGALDYSVHQWKAWLLIMPILGLTAALMTAFYVGRQWLLVFGGSFRTEQLVGHVREADWKMLLPLALLALLSFGWVFATNPLNADSSWFLQKMLIGADVPNPNKYIMELLSVIAAVSGLALAIVFYTRPRFDKLRQTWLPPQSPVRLLSFNFWYIDWLYTSWIPATGFWLVSALSWVDRAVVDRFVNGLGVLQVVIAHIVVWFDKQVVDGLVNLAAYLAGTFGKLLAFFQRGRAQKYIGWSVFGFLALAYWLLLT